MPPPPDSKPRILTPNAAKARALDNAQSRSPLPKSPPPSPSQSPKPSFFSSLRARYAALPAPFHRSVRVLRALAPLVPIGMFFSEHVMQVVWVRGSSMTPYLNENYEKTHTNSDMVLVSMWPWSSGGGGGIAWPFDWSRRRRLERGMLITFRLDSSPQGPYPT